MGSKVLQWSFKRISSGPQQAGGSIICQFNNFSWSQNHMVGAFFSQWLSQIFSDLAPWDKFQSNGCLWSSIHLPATWRNVSLSQLPLKEIEELPAGEWVRMHWYFLCCYRWNNNRKKIKKSEGAFNSCICSCKCCCSEEICPITATFRQTNLKSESWPDLI